MQRQRKLLRKRRQRQLLAAAALLCCCRPRQCCSATAASTSTLPAAAEAASSSSPTPTSTTFAERHRNDTLAFFRKFESHGPTLTLTLRDPSRTTLLGGGGGGAGGDDRAWRKILASGRSGDGAGGPPEPPPAAATDDGSFGLYSKLAGLFHISSSAAADDRRTSSSSSSQATSPFADGYMLDDGEIFLDPPSETSSPSSSRGSLFSMREVGGEMLRGTWGRTLSECARDVHPEFRQGIATREPSYIGEDTRPFPETAPWLSALSCGVVWSPFPVYKTNYPEGYGHKLLSVPHFVKCGARISLPRLSSKMRELRSTSRGIPYDFNIENDGPKTKELDLGVTYRESPHRPGGGGVELLLGRWRSSLPACPQTSSSEKHHGRNHLLVRFATGGHSRAARHAIEYARASFRLPAHFVLRNRSGVSVSPSFDFAEGTGRCVFSGDVGSSGRTRAVLRLDAEDSTLTVVRALDESKIIAPTIFLSSGKIVYDYYLNLDGTSSGQSNDPHRKANSSIRAHVDPTNGILLKWTDGIRGGRKAGSCWVTECRVPLGKTAVGPLAADLRVGRRWVV